MSPTQRSVLVCNRLTALGYAQHRKIRLYGEELELVSDAGVDGDGFAIEGIARKSGKLTRMRIPLHLVHTLIREIEVQELSRAA